MTTVLAEQSSRSSTVPPAWATKRNPLRPSYGPAVVAAAAMLGKPLMPWQAYVVTVGLEVQSVEAGDPDPGSWAYDTVGVSVQRQAGKTYLLRPVVAHRLRSVDGARVWQTAQSGVHARRRWLDLSESLTRSALGSDLRRKIGVGHEELRWLETGSTLEPFAPNGESLHGETPDLVLVDELWAFDAEEARELRQAYRPGFATRDSQVWLLSTAGTVESTWLNRLRARGRRAVEEGRQLRIAWFEWQVPDVVDGVPLEDLDDEALVRAVIEWHPARGHTLREASVWAAWEEAVEDDYATGRVEFLRAWGNRTPDSGRPRFYPLDVWERARTERELLAGRVALGFEVDPDGEESAVSAVAELEDGSRIVEVVERREGSTWLVPRILELLARHEVSAVGCNDAGPTREAADLLELAGVKLDRLTVRDYAAACHRVDRELREDPPTIRHRGQQSLDDDGRDVGRRSLTSGAWAYARTSVPVTGLVSATVGVWAWDHAPAPEPETRFWIG